MMKAIVLRIFFTLLSLTILATPVWGKTKPIEWKVQAFWQENSIPYAVFVDFCKRVKILTKGELVLLPYPEGKLVPTFKALDALQYNMIQAMHLAPVYWAEKDPAFAAIGDLIVAWTNPLQFDIWLQHKGGLKLLRELYAPYNAYPVGYLLWGTESLVSTVPIQRIEDFKGLKVRVPGGMMTMLFEKMGAKVIVLPGDQVYPALENGIIAAADWGPPSLNYDKGLYKVAKYSTFPGFHSMPLGDFTVNKDEWEKLPDNIKQILITATREWNLELIERIAIADLDAIKKVKADGVIADSWSEKELSKIRSIAEEVWDEWAKKSPMSKKIIQSQKSWLKTLGHIQ